MGMHALSSFVGLRLPQRHEEEAVHLATLVRHAVECVDHGFDGCRLARPRFLEEEDDPCVHQQAPQLLLIPLQLGNRSTDARVVHDIGAGRVIILFDDPRLAQVA